MNMLSFGLVAVLLAVGASIGSLFVRAQFGSLSSSKMPSLFRVAAVSFLAYFGMAAIGLMLAVRAHIRLFVPVSVLGTQVLAGGLIGLLAGMVIFVLDRQFFAESLPAEFIRIGRQPLFIRIGAGVLYGGIAEETAFRLLGLSGIICLALAIGAPESDQTKLICAGLVALLFGLAHLPITKTAKARSQKFLIRTVVLNGLGGLAYGYACVKFSFWAAVFSHMTTHLVLQPLAGRSQR